MDKVLGDSDGGGKNVRKEEGKGKGSQNQTGEKQCESIGRYRFLKT